MRVAVVSYRVGLHTFGHRRIDFDPSDEIEGVVAKAGLPEGAEWCDLVVDGEVLAFGPGVTGLLTGLGG